MADKLVPGIPHSTRIAILQQTDSSGQEGLETNTVEAQNKTVLQYVMSSDNHRNEVIRHMNGMLPILDDIYKHADGHRAQVLSRSFETEDPLEPVLAIRRIRHERTEKQLFLAQKNASLKSGTRGLQARKDLKVVEAKHQTSLELCVSFRNIENFVSDSYHIRLGQQKEAIDADAIKEDTQAAVETLHDLQSQFEAVSTTVRGAMGIILIGVR